MIVLGVDPGSRVTGVGVISVAGNRLKHIFSGPIRLKATDLSERLVLLHDQLSQLIIEHRPDAVAVEKVFHAVNVKSTLLLGQVRGVILLTAAKAGVPIREYSATEVKKAVVGFGRAEKAQMQWMVQKLLALPEIPKPHDVADALAIAICDAHSFKADYKLK